MTDTTEQKGPPEHIWLQYHGDADPADYPNDPEPSLDEVSWCYEPIFEHDIKYVRQDRYAELEERLATEYERNMCLISERDTLREKLNATIKNRDD